MATETTMETVTLEVPESQLLEWVRNLSPTAKRAVLREIVAGLDELDALVDYGSARIRQICAERGIDWDSLGEHDRQRLVDDLLHEA
jgi:hypothetical protein